MTAGENGSIVLESRKPPSSLHAGCKSALCLHYSDSINCIIFRLTFKLIVCFSLISTVFSCLNFNHFLLLSHRKWEINPSELTFMRELGGGLFGGEARQVASSGTK